MQQLTIYIQETDHWGRKPLYLRLLELARSGGGAGATVLRGVAGFGASSHLIHTAGFADLHQNLPLVIVIVDTDERIAALLPQIVEFVTPGGGLITIQPVESHIYLHAHKQDRGTSHE